MTSAAATAAARRCPVVGAAVSRLVGEPLGQAAVPRPLHGPLPRLVDRPDPRSRSASRSTTAARARPRRAGRSAGTGTTPISPSGTTRTSVPRSSRACELAGLAVLITVPLGVALAIGLTRWRGRGAGHVSVRLARPARHARDRHGRRSLPRVPAAAHVRAARDHGAGDRPRHLLAHVRAHHRARTADIDRAGVRGGGAGSRRVRRSRRSASRSCRC